ncbi:MAG: DUF3710 domain-containing protein [Aquiluna sp.]|nr:DUF3710 domain-containing protein [Aquiluna sp.]
MEKIAPEDRGENGPYDVAEIGVLTPYLDFGSIRLAPRQGMQIRADMDEATKKVVALTIEIQGHRLQLQAFAATKSEGLWTQTLKALEEGIIAQGGNVSVVEGSMGPELRGTVLAKSGDNQISRPTRFLGVDGPRWFLRAVVSSNKIDEAVFDQLVEVFRSTAVSRGDIAMPPGELLPLKLPVAVEQ